MPEHNSKEQIITVCAPGSVMLMGEHAVVFGHLAIACALDTYIYVNLRPRGDKQIYIDSALAQYHSDLDTLHPEPRLQFVLESVALFLADYPNGFDLEIRSEFSHTQGLGSSAAVTVATIKALAQYCSRTINNEEHLALALRVVHAVQGRGSGTDLAASIYGGLISYRPAPARVEKLIGLPPLALHFCGYKTTTAQVLSQVAEQQTQNPELYTQLYALMNQCCERAVVALQNKDWQHFGKLMDFYQGLMDALGVNDKTLSHMIYQLRQQQGVLGVKISGSGLGDCVISLGQCTKLEGFPLIDIVASDKGVVCCVN